MKGSEVTAARERLSLSVTELAADLGLTPHVVEAWEADRAAVPKKYSGELLWRIAALERDEALAASGLPVCSWVRDFERDAAAKPVRSRKDLITSFEALEKHVANCSACQTREHYIAERFGPMPPRPLPGIVGLIGRIAVHVDRLPPWARPMAWGALMFLVWSAFRIILTAPNLAEEQGGWLAVLTALAISAGMGAAFGAVYSAYRALRGAYKRP